MKTISEIYNSIKNRFKNKTNLDITEGTVLDSYLLSAAQGIEDTYQEIENSRNPHIFTNLEGENIDKMGLLINCARYPNESDRAYLYRCMNWTLRNESCNAVCIESALSSLEYSSNASYVPYTQGTGTATVYIIPKSYDIEIEGLAIEEIQNRLKNIVSPDSHIDYKIATPLGVRIVAYMNIDTKYDVDAIKNNLEQSIKKYINNIAIGEYFSYGNINKIGINEPGVLFFNCTHVYINDTLLSALKTIQKIDTKFLFQDIIWETVVD